MRDSDDDDLGRLDDPCDRVGEPPQDPPAHSPCGAHVREQGPPRWMAAGITDRGLDLVQEVDLQAARGLLVPVDRLVELAAGVRG